jgi:hypothetical protein
MQIAVGLETLACEHRHRHRAGRRLVLHVHGATAPQIPVVVDVARERAVLPVLCVGRHHVGMPEQRQRRAGALARDAGDQVGAIGVAGDQLALQAVGLEVALQHQRGRRLVAGRVGAVDADEVAREADRLLVQSGIDHGEAD